MAITLADFTKIWASTSPLTPYSFSDSNYEQGWNFVGATPPARQMWDSIQKQNDEKLKYIVDNFLPLAGGTMTGAIKGNPVTLTADDGNDSADLVLNSNGSMTLDGISLTDGSFLHIEKVTVTCTQTSSGGVSVGSVTAPAISGYKFLVWVQLATQNAIFPVYPEDPTSTTTTLFGRNTTQGAYIHCYALYIRKW